MTRVFVTGLGVVSSLGFGRDQFWRSITEGATGFSPIEGFDSTDLGREVAGEVKGFVARDFLTAAEARRMGRCSAYSLAAARMAVTDAGLTDQHLAGERTSVIMGTTMGEADVIAELEDAWIHRGPDAIDAQKIPRYGTTLLPIHLARAFGARGMAQTLPAACAAGNYSVAHASDLIRSGRADVVITGASELLQRIQFAGFVRLGAVAPDRCQPFDKNRKGLIVGEGAGVLVLESEAHAVRRHATPLAEVGGYGIACDAHHITRPHPDGEGSYLAMMDAISRTGVTPADIDFVNAHGTGTHHNDRVESQVMHKVFGDRSIPISSMKSMLGHCMGAASALEAVACVMTVQTGVYPPTVSYETPDPECDVNLVANQAGRGPAEVVLNNSLAFGGYDAVVAFARPGRVPAQAPAVQ
ncbi:MAG: beta-ketoacyl-[acyl-carrier-protein] synthase family protein [Myxococcales bacterium]|nr:beta-ketoacyl-[acyl-carrier-protein] synthase family protein [Myxococcales bacterium]MDD9969978.1 beta-ketoacyl-[acyl-carrier-protein] synthase family protein [Myxococcales bacterium]